MINIQKELKRKGFLFVISAPSGVGKSTLIKHLTAIDKELKFSISVTTREQRKDEIEGVDYFFKTKEEFYQLIEQNAFLEYAEVYGNFYGTLKSEVVDKLQQGFDVIMDIDCQGATLIKDRMPEDTLSIFVLPPSIEELERRIKQRNRDTEDIIRYRMAKSRSEIAFYYKYDYIIINDNLTEATQEIHSIVKCNRKKVDRMYNLKDLVGLL
ncbi:guanylate kinase [Rickettsiales bacterium LUAb2]